MTPRLPSSRAAQFRPLYRELGALRQCVPGIPFLALTATAAPRVRTARRLKPATSRPLLCPPLIGRLVLLANGQDVRGDAFERRTVAVGED